MASAGPSTSRQRTQDLLEPFINTLRLEQPITIPTETLLGAITHFLSTLPNRDVTRLIVSLIQSPSLWISGIGADEIRESIALAVEIKVNKIRARHRQSWFRNRQIMKDASRWLASVTDALPADESSESIVSTHLRLGLVRGLHAVELDCAKQRQELEEAVVMSLAEIMETSLPDRAALGMLCEAVLCLGSERLSVLDPIVGLGSVRKDVSPTDLQAIVPLLQNALFAVLDDGVHLEGQANAFSKAIARLFHVIAQHLSSTSYAVTPMAKFVAAFLDRAHRIEAQQGSISIKGKGAG